VRRNCSNMCGTLNVWSPSQAPTPPAFRAAKPHRTPNFEGMEDLEGKVAVVTGAGSGIGAAIARASADAGMAVAVGAIAGGRAREPVATIIENGGRAETYSVDVRDPDAVSTLADRVFDTFGACHLLCNNAGVCPLGCAWEHSFAEWQNTLAINLL